MLYVLQLYPINLVKYIKCDACKVIGAIRSKIEPGN
jgi:hypothetical protein